MISQAILVTTMLYLATEINSVLIPNGSCPATCGTLTIPFPFGTSSDCNLDDSFLITCDHNYNPPKPFLNSGTVEVLDISLDGLMKIASTVASDCYDNSGSPIYGTISELTLSKFSISSTQNKFTAIGCDTYAFVEGSKEWKQMTAGCVSWCDSIDSVVNGTCFGIGCCQTSIPKGVKDFLVHIQSFRNHTRVKSFNPCGYAFVIEAEAFEFSSSDLYWWNMTKTVPVVLDWSVGNMSCQEAQRNFSTFACQATHSECNDSSSDPGYNCNCLTGFRGNPYVVDGCQVACPEGFKGDGAGCHPQNRITGYTMFYIATGFMVPVVGSSWIFWRRKQRKVVNLRRNMFVRNGGQLLEHMLSGEKTFSIFTAEDLKEATDNYDENKVLYSEHNVTCYRGILPDGTNRLVTIKKYENYVENIEVFISKLICLSKINHRNVVRLLGCCLETQVPLLVYEFITVKTLCDYFHDDVHARSLSWDIRLRIAKETAGVLAYMHSATSFAIIHGSLNSSSILLHHGYTVKVHDFADSSFEFYCGEVDYVNPEYAVSHLLTSESDVYSFGVILAELLTGKKVISLDRPEGEERLAQYLIRILDNRLVIDDKIEQLTQVAKLAERCLSHSSVDRPTMEEVVIALENIISRNSSSTTTSSNSVQGTIARRAVRRINRSF